MAGIRSSKSQIKNYGGGFREIKCYGSEDFVGGRKEVDVNRESDIALALEACGQWSLPRHEKLERGG